MFQRILIANRGEIALRIIRACRELGIESVAVFSEADRGAHYLELANEAYCIGPAAAADSYLLVKNLISVAEIGNVQAVHPGYGFLAENANFASICESCGLKFIGPPPETIMALGDKARAKSTAKKAGCPVIPGSDGVVDDLDSALKEVENIGYPVFIKAVAGGGGKGIRIAMDEKDFRKQFLAARAEAEVSFANPDVYLEKMIVNPRHVEVQVLGDSFGNVVHLGERDCTVQRRRQKLIEEAPCPVLSKEIRKQLGESAVAVVKAAKYHSAGTVEFLLDENNDFYFMEVNTRIQVEHTVTEELTGIDLVVEQLRVAMGEKLLCTQEDIEFDGHVMQFRINAENPSHNFMPSPGRLEYYLPPGGPHVRVDSACYSGYVIPPNYDSMVAKLIVKGSDRAETVARARRALREFHIGGIHSTIPFHLFMLEDARFLELDFDLNYIDGLIDEGCDFVLDL